MKMKKRMLGLVLATLGCVAVQAAIPSSYTRLAYIKSNGTQWLDTGIKLQTPDDRVYMKFKCTSVGSGGVLFGNRMTASAKCFMASYNNFTGGGDATFAVTIDDSNYTNNRWETGKYNKYNYLNQCMEIDAAISSIVVYYNGVGNNGKAAFVPRNRDSFETVGTCTILKGVKMEGGDLPNANGCIGNLYAFQIRRNGELILDLVPVKAGSVVCMCDALTGTLYKNQNTASGAAAFTAGPTVKGELGIVTAPVYAGSVPAASGLHLLDTTNYLCQAVCVTNLATNMRYEPIGYGLSVYSVPSDAWGSATIFNGATYEHVQTRSELSQLTWNWRSEAQLKFDSFSGGVVCVNGEEIPPPASDPIAASLPAGCTLLEYISAAGEQFIDTGIKLRTPDDRVYMKFKCTEVGTGGFLFGSRKSADEYCFSAHYNNFNSGNNFAVNIDNSSYTYNRWSFGDYGKLNYLNYFMEINASLAGIVVYRNGVANNGKAACEPRNQDVFETIGTCTVLKGVLIEGGSIGNDSGCIGNLYRFRIERNAAVIQDLVPVRDPDGVACLYDLVTGTYFRNAGTGVFGEGPVAVTSAYSEVWQDTSSAVTLHAEPEHLFLGWGDGVTEEERLLNPLVTTLTRGQEFKPSFLPLPEGACSNAVWTGSADTADLSNAANWNCLSATGETIPGVPSADYSLATFSGEISLDFPAQTALPWRGVLFNDVTLARDCDWSAIDLNTIDSRSAIDLCGHNLTITGRAGTTLHSFVVTDSVGGGELHLVVAEGVTFTNKTIALTGRLRLVKDGAGAFVAARAGQSYSSGTEVATGSLSFGTNESPTGLNNTTNTVAKDAVLDMNGFYSTATCIYSYALAGRLNPTFSSSPAGSDPSKMVFGSDLILLDDAVIGGSNFYFASPANGVDNPARITFNEHTLTFSNTAYVAMGAWTNVDAVGTLRFASPSTVQVGASFYQMRSVKTVVEPRGRLFLQSNMDVGDLTYLNPTNWYAAGTDPTIRVFGTYVAGAMRPPLELQDGATLDLSGTNDVWNAAGIAPTKLSGNKTYTDAGRVSFAADATILVDVRARKVFNEEQLIAWTTEPSATFKFPSSKSAGLRLRVLENGLYVFSNGLTLILR